MIKERIVVTTSLPNEENVKKRMPPNKTLDLFKIRMRQARQSWTMVELATCMQQKKWSHSLILRQDCSITLTVMTGSKLEQKHISSFLILLTNNRPEASTAYDQLVTTARIRKYTHSAEYELALLAFLEM